LDVPISWKSKSQKHVTLSSTESEFVCVSEVVKAILFIKQILESIGITVQIPIKVYCDNVGVIYLSNSTTNHPATRHVSMRYFFTKELIEDGIIEFIFIRTAENEADIFTKNLERRLYDKHTSKMEEDIPEKFQK